MGKVTDYLVNLISKQVEANHLVVWFDPVGYYKHIVETPFLQDVKILCCKDPFYGGS